MPRYTAWSKYDGQLLPARNRAELDALIAKGHLPEPPEATETDEAVADAVEPAESDGGDPAAGEEGKRVRNRRPGGRLDQPDNNPGPVPDVAGRRDGTD